MVRRYVRKRTFSTADRILIHLSTDALRPEEQTQDGIANATQSGRSTLTKWLMRLERRGIVTRDRIRLPGHPLPKYAYRLSETGWHAASVLRQRLGSDTITVRTPGLGELSVRVSEVPRLAPSRLDLSAAVAAVRRGRLDLAHAARLTKTRGPLVWGGGLRRVDRFFGRTKELEDFDAWWASASHTLFVSGMAGIGKSALAATWVQGRRLGAPVYGFETRRSTTAAGLLSDLGAFLAAMGKPALAIHLDQGVPLDRSFLSRLLKRDLGDGRILVLLDNVDQAPPDLARLINGFFLQEGGTGGMKLMLLGRRFPRWLERSSPSDSEMDVLRLQGLDVAASEALLRSRGLGPDSALTEEIVRRTRGHPLLLHLSASRGTSRAAEVRRYLEDEVWGTLPSGDRAALEAASVLRKAASERVLASVAGARPHALEDLAERNLLERTVAGSYTMHDLVREFVGAQLPEGRKRRLHTRAATALLGSSDSRERWEGVYHLLQAGRMAEAAALLDAEGTVLLDSVAAEEITSLARRLTLQETESATYCVFAEILGDSLRIRGHLGPARFQYEHARHLAEASGRTERTPRLLRKMAFLERCRNRYSKALGYLVEARARLLETRNPAEMVEVLREMALAEQALGELDSAARHLNEAVDLATELSDRAALSRTLLALGSLDLQRGHPDEGLASDLEGLRVAERSGSVTEIAHAHIVVGAALIGMGRAEESLRHLTDGLEAARLLGNLRLMAYATLNETSAFLHLERYREAGTSLRQAKECFDRLEEKDSAGFLKTYEGELEMGLGHWSRAVHAFGEGIDELRSHGSPTDLALVLQDVARFYVQHGNEHQGRSYLVEARVVARRVGNPHLLAKIDTDLSLLRPASPRENGL